MNPIICKYKRIHIMTNFEKVVDFNRQFGVLKDDTLNAKTEIIKENPGEVEACLKLIREEVRELEDAVKDNDFVETVDALTDILYVVYGMGARIGVDMDKALSLVHDNNMSKLCDTEEEAIASVKYYEINKEKYKYEFPAYKLAPDGKHFVVYNKSPPKVLKSIKWKPVDLQPLFDTKTD